MGGWSPAWDGEVDVGLESDGRKERTGWATLSEAVRDTLVLTSDNARLRVPSLSRPRSGLSGVSWALEDASRGACIWELRAQVKMGAVVVGDGCQLAGRVLGVESAY